MKSTQRADKRETTIVSVMGAKGGVGASTVALNAACLAARVPGSSVLLLDFDLHCQGDLESMISGSWKSIADVTHFMERRVPAALIKSYLTHDDGPLSCVRAFARHDADELVKLTPDTLAAALNYLAEAFDLVVADCGAVIAPLHVPIIAGAGKILIVTSSRIESLGHAHKKYEQCARGYIPTDTMAFIVNMWSEGDRIPRSLVAERLPKAASFFVARDVPAMDKAYEKASAAVVCAPRGDFAKSLEECVRDGMLAARSQGVPLAGTAAAHTAEVVDHWMRHASNEPVSAQEQAVKRPKPDVSRPHTECRGADAEWTALKKTILRELFKTVDLKQVGAVVTDSDRTKLARQTTDAILKIVNDIGEEKVPQGKRKQLVDEVLNEALGLGPLEMIMADPGISEIMVNGTDRIYVERSGKLELSDLAFTGDEQLYRIIERIVSPIGRRVDESTPLVDARLADGSRVNIIIPPLALKGPTITIRRFSKQPLKIDDLIGFGALTGDMASFLKSCIEAKLNIIVSGGTGSGKTTLLNALSSFIPEGDRIITIEDAAELKLHQPHVVTLEARPPNLEGKGAITIRDLVRNALRMRPDRIVVGECRGGEALDMLQAMNTGHDGSMTTVHANSAKDAVSRLETLVMFSGIELPSRAIREQIVGGIHLIVQLSRFSDGSRKIADISEITGMEGTVVTLQSIFRFKQRGIDSNRRVVGSFEPSGIVPKFFDVMQEKGMNLSRDIFTDAPGGEANRR